MVDKMARARVLFADDQIPDDTIPDDRITSTLKEQHPQWNDRFIQAFVATRQAVKTLRGAGYEVTVARTYKGALELVKSSRFEIAIVDLGWFADEDLRQPDFAGWDICEAIDKADEEHQSGPTLQIIYSYRFAEDPSVSVAAADKDKLPVFKNYTNATDQALRAAVKFLETHLEGSSSSKESFANKAVRDFHEMTIRTLKDSLARQKQWFLLTLVFVALSITLVLVASILVILGNIRAGTFASISSSITSVISTLLFVQLRRGQVSLETSEERLGREYSSALERLYKTTGPASAQDDPHERLQRGE
jgi:CheY-like chemotaxis protein